MGSRENYDPGVGITFFEYKAIGTIDGVKIIVKPGETKPALPVYSNTADTAYILAKTDRDGRFIPMQLRVFRNHLARFDVDFDHPQDHNLAPGEFHTHAYEIIKTKKSNKPTPRRMPKEHVLTEEEHKQYDPLINKLRSMHNRIL